MEKITTQSSEAILEKGKHALKQLPNSEEVEASIERLSVPFKEIEYAESGTVEMEVNDGKLELRYSPVGAHLQDGLKTFLDHMAHEQKITNLSESAKLEGWKMVDRLKFVSGDKTYNILKLFPGGYNIFFCPKGDETTGVVMYSKDIYIVGDIATPKAIITILHEIGHIWDDLKLKIMNKDHLVDDHKYSAFAERLRKERMATAYALTVMRPFFKDETQKKDALNFLKHYALFSYHANTLNEIKEREYYEAIYSKDMDWYREQTEDDYFLYAFEQWKKTSQYEKLKHEFSPPGTHPDEEFALWREWQEKNKYEFWNDYVVFSSDDEE